MLRLSLLLFAAIPSIAHAEWRKAESPHFIVYSEDNAEDLRKSVVKLEKYHRLLQFASKAGNKEMPVKLPIYLMSSTADLQRTLPGGGGGVLAYYTSTERGPVIVGLTHDPKAVEGVGAHEVLQHEYAHHFMLHYFPVAYPTWFTEGFAEYYGHTKIRDDDVVEVGHAALSRYKAFGYDWLPLERMLTANSYDDVGIKIGHLYAQGWLLVHYLTHSEDRKGQLETYLNAINAGESYEAAMNRAFGHKARDLDSELRKYSSRRVIPALAIPFKPLELRPIEVTTLPAAQQALIKRDIDLRRGLLVREAEDFARDVRAEASKYPNDPYALSILVEAERAAGNDAAAKQALERWIAAAPNDPHAKMHKAELAIKELQAAKSTDEARWGAARALLAEAHKAAPNDPMILEAYYDSYVAQGAVPPAGAQNALYRAHELVPGFERIRYKLARDFEQRGMLDDAIATIMPAAFEMHAPEDESEAEKRRREKMEDKYRGVGEEKRETAREMLVRLQAKQASGGTVTAATAN